MNTFLSFKLRDTRARVDVISIIIIYIYIYYGRCASFIIANITIKYYIVMSKLTMGAGVLNLINRQFGVQRIDDIRYTPVHSVCVCVQRTVYTNIYIYIVFYYYAYIIVIYGITYGSGARRSRMQHPAKLINNCIRTSAWNRIGSVFGPKAILSRALLSAAVVVFLLSYTEFFFFIFSFHYIYLLMIFMYTCNKKKKKIRRARIEYNI